MIDRELAAKIRRIQIQTGRNVSSTFAGEYTSAFKGHGMEFEEVRAYQPGDDIKSIDWNVTARTGEPYIKRFREERELTVILVLDLSASGNFGSTGKKRNDIAAEICAVLSFSAIKNNDRVGLLVFTEEVEMFIPPGKGLTHTMRIIREILAFNPVGKGTSINNALAYLGKVQRKNAVVFLISDFIDEGFEKNLKMMSEKHDLVAISVSDPLERELPDCGLVTIRDAETGQFRTFDSSNRKVRAQWTKAAEGRIQLVRKLMTSLGLDHVHLDTGKDWIHTLSVFFIGRQTRLERRR
ncbi:DUF58 domain-containing protein [Spirochaeta isovalerica]|uniref:Uncharacterized protein (DUF58 family) n=1 Tax=Spirochaeta isovalerica TaxID=150 RepID=A0A841R4G5_9SPIO|nr:DUF58 domain-containing protein [Spirochaeta isovalerica]MBB6478755.1 uncharacterized protein (DUF58 family) [Spirochaeta isovalerica]